MKKIHATIFFGAVTILVFLLGMGLLSERGGARIEGKKEINRYERNYCLVSTDRSEQWQSIYKYASEQAQLAGACLQWIGQNIPGSYSTRECLQMAVASSPDGILLFHETGEDVSDLLEEAAKKQIPVVTVMNDVPLSLRTSYVGLNSWQLGDIYGAQVRASLKTGNNKIVILSASPKDNEFFNNLYVRMSQKIQEYLPEEKAVDITYKEVDTSLRFNAEETIREMFVKKEETPDILVCLDAVSTECALQEVIDYNEVGRVQMLGYYTAEDTIDAIDKNIMKATIAVDTEQIGRACVDALNEYLKAGYVSDYNSVAIKLVNQRNIEDYKKQEEYREEEDATA